MNDTKQQTVWVPAAILLFTLLACAGSNVVQPTAAPQAPTSAPVLPVATEAVPPVATDAAPPVGTAIAPPPTTAAPPAATDAPPAPTAPAVVPTVVAPPPTALPAPTGSPLKSRDTPPGGVAEQLGFFGSPAANVCGVDTAAAPGVLVVPSLLNAPPLEIAESATICLDGFNPDRPLTIELTWPDGTSETSGTRGSTLRDLNGGFWSWYARPGAPTGRYRIRVTQGDRQANGRFEVEPAATPRILVVPGSGAAGALFRVLLAGFPPEQPVSLFLYRAGTGEPACEGAFCYTAALPPIAVDARGEEVYTLATEPDDPPGRYRIEPAEPLPSPSQTYRSFSVNAPGGGARRRDQPSGLQRRDAPPGGVQSQIATFGTGGGPTCLAGINVPLAVEPNHPGITVGETVALCFVGFAPDRPVDVEVVAPDGGVRLRKVVSDSTSPEYTDFTLFWRAEANVPQGEYVVNASQGDRSASAVFTVRPATQPHILLSPRYSLPPGAAYTIDLVGFAPGTTARLHVYALEGTRRLEYRATLAPVLLDAAGRGTATLATAPDDPPGTYVILSDEQAQQEDYALVDSNPYVRLTAVPDFPGTLRRGAQGPAVTTLQMRLVQLGYGEVGAIDGIFGRNTEAAVRAFQARSGLEVDGIAGPRTWERLFGPAGALNG